MKLFRKKITEKRLKESGWHKFFVKSSGEDCVWQYTKLIDGKYWNIFVQSRDGSKGIIVWVRGFLDGQMVYWDELEEFLKTGEYKSIDTPNIISKYIPSEE